MTTLNRINAAIHEYKTTHSGNMPKYLYLGMQEFSFLIHKKLMDNVPRDLERYTYNGIEVHIVDSMSHIGVSKHYD